MGDITGVLRISGGRAWTNPPEEPDPGLRPQATAELPQHPNYLTVNLHVLCSYVYSQFPSLLSTSDYGQPQPQGIIRMNLARLQQ